MVKKGYFFSVDVLVSIMIIVVALSIVHIYSIDKSHTEQETFFASDFVEILSTVRLEQLTDPNLTSVINESNPPNWNLTILEHIGRLYVLNRTEQAERILKNLTAGTLPSKYGFGIWASGGNSIYNNSKPVENILISSKQLISGIEESKPTEGFNSRVFLTGFSEQGSTSYAYFGGYIGDGTILKRLVLPSSIDNVSSAYMEMDAGSDFDLYINSVHSGYYNVSIDNTGNLTADNWTINASYLTNFNGGNNTIRIEFTNASAAFIGGGYIRVGYMSSELVQYSSDFTRKYLSGIEGIVNTYDSIYVPGFLDNMSIYLNYESDYPLFMTIGNATIMNSSPTGSVTLELTDINLTSLVNYSLLDGRTNPFRLGIATPPEGEGGGGSADIILITDLSRSMNWTLNSDLSNGTIRDCTDPLLYDPSTSRISLARCLDKMFIDTVLNGTNHRVSTVAFYGLETGNKKGFVLDEDLTGDGDYLKQQIETYTATGGTCVCCAINRGREILYAQSPPTHKKYMIIMSDGVPTHDCDPGVFKTGDDTVKECQGNDTIGTPNGVAGCYGDSPEDCTGADCLCSIYNANFSSCQANSILNSTHHSIGFGPVAQCEQANYTLKGISDCGGGEFYVSDNATLLEQFYKNISEQIRAIGYSEQTAYTIGNFSTTYLYPDSYIQYNFTPTPVTTDFGRVPVTMESTIFGNEISEGVFEIPSAVSIYDAKVTSYSAEKWTDKAFINNSANYWTSVYNLSLLGSIYHNFGDPYIVNIPIEYIQTGNNTVRISTGVSHENATSGSTFNKVIFTIGIDTTLNFSGVFGTADGCTWNIQFEDDSNVSVKFPATYNGTQNCSFYIGTDCDVEFFDDSVDNSVCHLLKKLDFDGDGKLFVKFGPDDLDIDVVYISNIPYMWGPTVLEVRVWQ